MTSLMLILVLASQLLAPVATTSAADGNPGPRVTGTNP